MIHTIRRLFSQFVIYGFFAALGSILAEVFSYNYTEAVLVPWGYLPYGLLYILFVDALLRRRVRDWKIVYLYGVLVGFITEGFAAKVVFFGWDVDSVILLGFAPAETLYLTFVYHPLFSFILPVFIARNFFGFPFALPKAKRPIITWLVSIPLYALVLGSTNANDLFWLVIYTVLTFFVFGIWMALLKKWGGIESIALGKIARAGVWFVTIAFYVFAWFFFHKEPRFPPWPATVVALFFTVFVFILIAIKVERPTTSPITYVPRFPFWQRLGYCAPMTALLVGAAINPAAVVFNWIFSITFIAGIVLGPLYFAYVTIDAVIRKLVRLLKSQPQKAPTAQ